jgi:hypothetical protein
MRLVDCSEKVTVYLVQSVDTKSLTFLQAKLFAWMKIVTQKALGKMAASLW